MMESKFDFQEDTNVAKKQVQQEAKGFFISVFRFISALLSIRRDTDYKATLQAIHDDIPLRGATAWVLICSIFLASIGLNANSTPVVIGAMLIAPLMGPVLGIGVSLALNDLATLRRSLVNFGVMVLLSVLTATLFFTFFPLREESSELLARVSPDIRDVLIAFFGGLALIIARTKKGTIASVIFGVAIATALMPPLCTVGYALAHSNISYAVGALYLFAINASFIALAAYLVVKLLRFPMTEYANAKSRRRTSRLATLLALLLVIPAVFTFVDVLQKSRFQAAAILFLENELTGIDNADYLRQTARIEFADPQSKVIINTFGMAPLAPAVESLLKERIKTYESLATTELIINQMERENNVFDQQRYLLELRKRDSLELMRKQTQITLLEERIGELDVKKESNIAFSQLATELKVISPYARQVRYAQTFISNFDEVDTLAIFSIQWESSLDSVGVVEEENRLRNWLELKLKNRPFRLESSN
jgi:uncharacterized hydrophobic protein (TIGR00271 family)